MNKFFWIAVLFCGLMSAQPKKWTLEECIQHAYKHNISIRQTELDIRSSEVEKQAAIGNFLPGINANATHSWNIGLNQNITTGLLENQTVQFTSAGVNMGVVIYNGLQNQNRLRRANLAIVAAKYQLDKMRDDISLNVANAFLQILFNKENLKVQKEQLAQNLLQEERTRELVNAGNVPRGDLLDINATVAGSRRAVVDAENALLISRLSLAQLLQIEDFQNFDIADRDYEAESSAVMMQTADSIYKKAKDFRVEIKLARANLDVAERDVRIAKGAFQPSLQGFYSMTTRAAYADRVVNFVPDPFNPFNVIGIVEGTGQNVLQPNFIPILGKPDAVFNQFDRNKGHSFGLQLNIPILNGLSARTAVDRAKIALERSKIAMDQTELDLERNVYTAFTDANGALNAYEAAGVALAAREEAFKYAKERFDVGLMNSFDYNQAQLLYTTAQSDLLRAKYDYIFRVKVVELYFGIPITLN